MCEYVRKDEDHMQETDDASHEDEPRNKFRSRLSLSNPELTNLQLKAMFPEPLVGMLDTQLKQAVSNAQSAQLICRLSTTCDAKACQTREKRQPGIAWRAARLRGVDGLEIFAITHTELNVESAQVAWMFATALT
uniref:Uncharacterized protein n=1 Tax=Ascaris lumbricoides TaxID=6252 RepID=A0A9J2PKB1_ASCLU